MFNIRKIQEQNIFNAIKAASSTAIALDVVYGDNNTLTVDDASWVITTMKRLEERFDTTTVKQIRMNCQCGYGMDEKLTLVKELIALSSTLEEFASHQRAKAAGLFYRNNELYLQFDACPCPMLATVNELPTDTWCQCTTGYSKALFEEAFGCTVDVELLKSIKVGHEQCLMKIVPHGRIWK